MTATPGQEMLNIETKRTTQDVVVTTYTFK